MEMLGNQFRIALIVNPWAGVGGEPALKGSDGREIQALALEKGATPKASDRVVAFLRELLPVQGKFACFTFPGAMGADQLASLGFQYHLLDERQWPVEQDTGLPLCSAKDTESAARLSAEAAVDVLVFAGGDGTARDVLKGLQAFPRQVCLGIPCGVKIHSGVFGRSPQSSAALLLDYYRQGASALDTGDVRDIDEQALREGRLNSRSYGELWVLASDDMHLSVQSSKEGASQYSSDAQEQEALIHEEMAAFVLEHVNFAQGREDLLIIGAGLTTQAIKRHLGDEASLLGVDVFLGEHLLLKDASEQSIYDCLQSIPEEHPCKLLVSIIGGQGFVFGRGNQQLSARIITQVLDRGGDEALWILASEAKLASLSNNSLFVDTGDEHLNQRLSGSRMVLSNYEQFKLCKIVN